MGSPSAAVLPTLVIFDIDGTLVDSTALHHAALAKALNDLGFDPHVKPWASYRNYTDSGVLDELCTDRRGTGATAAELSALDRLTSEAFAEHLGTAPLSEIAGAKILLAALKAETDFCIGFATGSMRETAEAKLASLGLDPARQITATGSEFITRRDIVQSVLAQASRNLDGAFKVVVLGDGVWDERTASLLGLSFIAVETGLHRFATGHIVKDLTQLSPDILRRAAIPTSFI